MFRLLSSLPKAAFVAIGSLALAGGAVGAAASAGGTEVPRPIEAVLSALGFSSAGLSDDVDGTATPGAGRGKHARATGTATSTPVAASIPGLCRAWASGSERGRQQKQDGYAFVRLKNAAAGAGQSVEAYCETILVGRRPTPSATGTAASGNSQRGKSEDARGNVGSSEHGKSANAGKSDERGRGYSPAAGGASLGTATAQADDDRDNRGKGKPEATPAATAAGGTLDGPGASGAAHGNAGSAGGNDGGGGANAGGANSAASAADGGGNGGGSEHGNGGGNR